MNIEAGKLRDVIEKIEFANLGFYEDLNIHAILEHKNPSG